MQGSWIYEEDAYEFFERTEMVWCNRAGCEIEIYPIFALSPSEDQYRAKPTRRNT